MTYAAEVLADAPVAFLPLDETSGLSAANLGSLGTSFAYASTTTLGAPGVVTDGGTAARNSGANGDWIAALAGLDLATLGLSTGGVSVEVWVDLPDADVRGEFVKVGTVRNGWGVGVGNGTTTSLGRQLTLEANDVAWQPTGYTLTPGLHHIVVTRSATDTYKWYVDGALIGSRTFGANTATDLLVSGNIDIGAGSGVAPLSSTVAVDAPAWYAGELSATRIAVHYQAGTAASGGSTGVLEVTLPAATITLAGTVEAPPTGGVLDVTLPALVVDLGQDANPTATASIFPDATWVAEFSPAVAEPPHAPRAELVKTHVTPTTAYVNSRPTFTTRPVIISETLPRDRVVVGGRDVTYFRGVATPTPGYLLTEPLGYGSTTITFPQVNPALESDGFGSGDLEWVRLEAPVVIERVDPATNEVIARDYRGDVLGVLVDGASLSLEVGGKIAGRASIRNKQIPLWRYVADVRFHAHDAIKFDLRLPFRRASSADKVGIDLVRTGGMTMLDWLSRICAMAVRSDGQQFTIMPESETSPYWVMRQKDITTRHATVYFDDTRIVAQLKRDLAEEPNTYYATGVTPQGLKVKFGAYPGLLQGAAPDYPLATGAPFGPGTTNDDLDNPADDPIGVMVQRLIGMGYVSIRDDQLNIYGADVADGIRELQDDAGLPKTGIMTTATWGALWDLGVTGYTLQGAKILPAVTRPYTRKWILSASGVKIGPNPAFDAARLPVDRNIDFGSGQTRQQMRAWCRQDMERGAASNWAGTIAFNGFGAIPGEHNPGDPTPAGVMSIRDLRPGMNIWCPRFDGGTLLHVSGVQVDDGGRTGTATVDTRYRDMLTVTEILQRNQDSRFDPARAWLNQHRKSSAAQDAMVTWDEVGGTLYAPTRLAGDTWNHFPVVAGQAGEIQRLRLRLYDNPCEFVVAIFSREPSDKWLNGLVGNPFDRAADGELKWTRAAVRDRLDRRVLLYAAGTDQQPCGYWPGQKYSEDTGGARRLSGDALTGVFQDDANFTFRSLGQPVLWVAIYPRQGCKVARGQVMWPQLEEGQ